MEPKRIQRKRSKGWRKPENTVNVTRPGKWGNPFRIEKTGKYYTVINDINGYVAFMPDKRHAASHAAKMFEHVVLTEMDVSELRGRDLMCFCGLDEPCHADAILKKANEG